MSIEIATPIKIWQPVAYESLIGIIAGTRQALGAYGENRQVLVNDKGGNVTAVWLTRRLKNNLKAQRAEVGDLITLTYLGKKSSSGGRFYTEGRSYNDYQLIVDKI
jgi:creatinine amidohydrolase/Fe(II)-dependent formamide hydrolase-like protein